MTRQSGYFIAGIALAGTLALAGCNQKPEVLSEAAGSAMRSEPWDRDLKFSPGSTAGPTATSPGGTDFVGGAWNASSPGGEPWKAGPKLDFAASPSPDLQAKPAGTSVNPFIGIDFTPGTDDVRFVTEVEPETGRVKVVDAAVPGSVDDILSKMKQADQLAPTAEYERIWVQARNLVTQDQLDTALALFAQLRQLNPKDARAFVGEGIIHLRRKDFKQAAASFEFAVRTDPTILETYQFLAQAHLALDNPTAALADYDALLRRSPENTEALLNRVSLLFQQRRYKEMLVDTETLIRTRPTLPEGFLYRAVGYLMTGQTSEAQADFEKSVRLGLSKETEKILRPRFFPVVP